MSVENTKLAECKGVKNVMLPVDLNTAAITGSRIALKDNHKVAVILSMGDSVGATVQVTYKQHTLAAGGVSSDLVVANPYFVKKAAETSFTKVEPSVAAALVDVSSVFANDEGILILEISGDQLSEGNGFFSIDIADSGAAKIGAAVYVTDVKSEPAYSLAL